MLALDKHTSSNVSTSDLWTWVKGQKRSNFKQLVMAKNNNKKKKMQFECAGSLFHMQRNYTQLNAFS